MCQVRAGKRSPPQLAELKYRPGQVGRVEIRPFQYSMVEVRKPEIGVTETPLPDIRSHKTSADNPGLVKNRTEQFSIFETGIHQRSPLELRGHKPFVRHIARLNDLGRKVHRKIFCLIFGC